MRKWRIEGWLDGELTGEISAVDIDEQGRRVPVSLETAEREVFGRPPRWQEFWEGAPTAATDETEVLRPSAFEDDWLPELDAESQQLSASELVGVSAKRLWAWAFVLALLGIGARMFWYFQFQDEFAWRLGPQGMSYLGQAVAYMSGGITDGLAGNLPSAYREVAPPGYALFIAALMEPFGAHQAYLQSDAPLMTVRAVQWLMAGGITLMTFALARRVLFGWSALVPAALVTASVALVDLPSLLANETLLAFLVCAAVLLLVKAGENQGRARGWLVTASALTYSYAVLVQPRVILLLPFAAFWIGRVARARAGVGFVLLALLLPAGWVARDYVLFDEIVPISIAGQAALYQDNVMPIGGIGTEARAVPPECPRSQIVTAPVAARFAWARCMQTAGIDQILAHPAKSAQAVPDRIAALFSPWNPTRARGQYATPHWDYHYLVPIATRRDTTFMKVDRILNYIWVGGFIAL
ncbi:MAG: hypothetical protein JHC87_09590, partial [Thermoleophilaceae bacterium]|nr:hypothetical protein [Thermoleophilaceae bacterium]